MLQASKKNNKYVPFVKRHKYAMIVLVIVGGLMLIAYPIIYILLPSLLGSVIFLVSMLAMICFALYLLKLAVQVSKHVPTDKIHLHDSSS